MYSTVRYKKGYNAITLLFSKGKTNNGIGVSIITSGWDEALPVRFFFLLRRNVPRIPDSNGIRKLYCQQLQYVFRLYLTVNKTGVAHVPS